MSHSGSISGGYLGEKQMSWISCNSLIITKLEKILTQHPPTDKQIIIASTYKRS